MADRTDLSNILINFLKKARYQRHIDEGTLEEGQFYATTDGNEQCEYGDLFGDIENQEDLYNALYASSLIKMEMCNDPRGYELVHKLYDRREFDLSKFTVTNGSITVTDNGELSDFKDNSVLNLDIPQLSTANEVVIKMACIFTHLDNVEGLFCLHESPSSFLVRQGAGIRVSPDGGTNYAITNRDIQLNKKYYITVTNNMSTNRIKLDVIDEDGIIYTDSTNVLDGTLDFTLNKIRLGGASIASDTYNWLPFANGKIFAKEFSVICDGVEVFNGIKNLTQYDAYILPSSEVITIPYILSVDGVKIVDVAYKSLVDQLYAETGNDNYIIIDEINETFRLPMQDIYSQLGRKTSFIIRTWED